MKNIFKAMIMAILLMGFSLTSCEVNKFLNQLKGTNWSMVGENGYRELLKFDQPKAGEFNWIQYSGDLEIDNIVGKYETFASVLGGDSYANLNIILEKQKKNIVYQYYFPDPSKDGRATVWLIGKEKTIYSRIVEKTPAKTPAKGDK